MIKRRHAGAGESSSWNGGDETGGSLLEDRAKDRDRGVRLLGFSIRSTNHANCTNPSTLKFGRRSSAILFSALLLAACVVAVLLVGGDGMSDPAGGRIQSIRRKTSDGNVPGTNGEAEASSAASAPSKDFFDGIKSIRAKFETRYGGSDAAYAMLGRGIETFSDRNNKDEAIRHTAARILRAAASSDPRFVASFGGYSVTVGRGNLFSQSFPFVMEGILKGPLKEIGVDLVVRNAAIGGIPSFPYGWCLPNFLGVDSDVVSWDYSMNEGGDAAGLEAYVRHALTSLPKRPLVVVLDNKRPRMDLIKKYVKLGTLVDPVAIIRGDNIVDKKLLYKKEEDRPEGLTRWDEWGAPKGSPGQSSWHPKFREHELMGWMLAIHLLDAIEAAGHIMGKEPNWREKYADSMIAEQLKLPPPQSKAAASEASILDGAESLDGSWHLNPVSCRTSFLPVVSDSRSLSSIVVSGAAEDDGDAMKSKDEEKYSEGWVIDVGKVERDTKRKVEKTGGMGYIDMKLAFYGIPESGPIRFWIPYEGQGVADDATSAKKYFDTIVICEVNEKRGDKECKLDSDITYIVGGVRSDGVKKIKSIASYLRKEICVKVPIPDGADIVTRNEAQQQGLNGNTAKLGNGDEVGIFLDAEVTNKAVSRKDGACSISHVVWEQH